MKYLSGLPALNIPCSLDTDGDWHYYSQPWQTAPLLDTDDSPYGTWGIEQADVPERGLMYVANHIRACLDFIVAGDFGNAGCMQNDYIVNDKYIPVIFAKVTELKNSSNWPAIDTFMGKEYKCDWLDYKSQVGL